MMAKAFKTSLKPPFLRRISAPAPTPAQRKDYPLGVPFLKHGLDLQFTGRSPSSSATTAPANRPCSKPLPRIAASA